MTSDSSPPCQSYSAAGGILTAEAVKAAVDRLRNQKFVPYHPGCMHAGPPDGACYLPSSYVGKESCEHEHIYTAWICEKHKDVQSSTCGMCWLEDSEHVCATRLFDVKKLF